VYLFVSSLGVGGRRDREEKKKKSMLLPRKRSVSRLPRIEHIVVFSKTLLYLFSHRRSIRARARARGSLVEDLAVFGGAPGSRILVQIYRADDKRKRRRASAKIADRSEGGPGQRFVEPPLLRISIMQLRANVVIRD